MRLNHALLAFRNSRSWLAFCSRICCVLFLCAAYLSAHGDYRVPGSSSVARDLSDAPVSSDGADKYSCGAQQLGNDVILPDGRDNDPFLVFLSLRAAFVSGPIPFLKGDRLLSETGTILVGTSPPPDARSPHLYILSQSAQLLC